MSVAIKASTTHTAFRPRCGTTALIDHQLNLHSARAKYGMSQSASDQILPKPNASFQKVSYEATRQ